MIICKKPEVKPKPKVYKHPPVVSGHLYRNTNTNSIHIAAYVVGVGRFYLVSLQTGVIWSGVSYNDSAFGDELGSWNQWEDVTDKYCLTDKE